MTEHKSSQHNVLPESARIVPGFTHEAGHHCASTALADLARWNGLPWTEAMCFGLGAGVGFAYMEQDGGKPSRLMVPRAADLELSFLDAIGLSQPWQTGGTPDEAWAAVRTELDKGRPVLMLTDLYYLDYYDTNTHFSGHALVLAGYDPASDTAYTADTERPGLQQTSLASLAESRRSNHFPSAIDHHWIPGGPWQPKRQLEEAVRIALGRAARQLLEPQSPAEGVNGLRLWAERIHAWGEVPDWSWSARFAFQVIERRGTGGSAFRKLYRDFLHEALKYVPALKTALPAADDAVAQWRELGFALRSMSTSETVPDFAKLAQPIAALADTEERLFTVVAEAADQAEA